MADDAIGIAELSATGTASNTTWVTPTDIRGESNSNFLLQQTA